MIRRTSGRQTHTIQRGAEFVSRSTTEDIVLCGNSLSDAILQDLNAKLIYLLIDNATLVTRLSERADNDYGKSESELAEIRHRHRVLDDRFLSKATVIDATLPLETVVAKVIDQLQ